MILFVAKKMILYGKHLYWSINFALPPTKDGSKTKIQGSKPKRNYTGLMIQKP